MREENFFDDIEEKLQYVKDEYKKNEDEVKLIDRLIYNVYKINKKCLRKGKVKKRKEQIYNDNRYITELLVDKRDKLIIENEELNLKMVCREIVRDVEKNYSIEKFKDEMEEEKFKKETNLS